VKKKRDWSRWFDQLDEEKISSLFAGAGNLPDPQMEHDEKFRFAVNNLGKMEKVIRTPGRKFPAFFRPNLVVKFALATAVSVFIAVLLLYDIRLPSGSIETSRFSVSDLRGTASFIDESGGSKPLRQNSVLGKDVVIVTEAAARVGIAGNDTVTIDIDENTKLKLKHDSDGSAVFLYSGRARFVAVENSIKGKFVVETDLFAVSMTGTEFVIENGGDQATINLVRGSLNVTLKYDVANELRFFDEKNPAAGEKINDALNPVLRMGTESVLKINRKDVAENERNIREFLRRISQSPDEVLRNKAEFDSLLDGLRRTVGHNINVLEKNMPRPEPEAKQEEKGILPEPTRSGQETPTSEPQASLVEQDERKPSYRDKLVGEWLFSGDANDSSGFSHHGLVRNAKLAVDRFGKEASAFYFNGTGSIRIKNNDVFKEIEKINDFSFSIWINIERWYQGYFPVFDKYFESAPWQGGFGYVMEVTNFRGITFLSNRDIKFDAVTKPVPGRWYHIVFISDGKNGKIYFYFNGRKDNEINGRAQLNTDEDFYIGYSPSGGLEYAIGMIDDFRMFNTALSPEQVLELYGEGGWNDGKQ
jgi:hypothetical protein